MEKEPTNPEFAFNNSSTSYQAIKKEHSRLGSRAARWIVGGTIGLGCFAVLIAFVLFSVFRVSPIGEGLGERLIVNKMPQEAIYYRGGATQAQAVHLGNFLKRWEMFTGQGGAQDIILSRDGNTYIVSVPLIRDWDDPQTVDFFTQMRTALSAEVFDGAPTEVHLIDTVYRTQGELGVRRVIR
jgi:hypothetical protein